MEGEEEERVSRKASEKRTGEGETKKLSVGNRKKADVAKAAGMANVSPAVVRGAKVTLAAANANAKLANEAGHLGQ